MQAALRQDDDHDAIVLIEKVVGPVEMPRCPVCACTIEDEPVTCPRCATPHHRECWDYAEGCAIFGCDSRGWRSKALDLRHFELVMSRTRTWSRLFRFQWIAFAVAAAAIVLTICGATLPHEVYWRLGRLSPLAYWLAWLGKPLMATGAIACQLAVVAYLALLVPAKASQRELEEELGQRLLTPREGGRALMDRVQTPPMARFLGWAMGGCTILSVLVAGALLWVNAVAPRHLQLATGLSEILTLVLLGVFFPLGAMVASRLRLSYVQTVQNRVQASLKG